LSNCSVGYIISSQQQQHTLTQAELVQQQTIEALEKRWLTVPFAPQLADIEAAAQTIVTAKNFDYGSPCSAPSVIMLHADIAAQMQQALARQGAHVCSEQEAQKIQNYAFSGGKFNGKVVGRPASPRIWATSPTLL
jgi:gamma-glutamyl phosphate reductase